MTLPIRRRDWLQQVAAVMATAGLPAWAAATPAAAPLTVPPIQIRRRVLANGLQVISQPGGGGGSVSVQVWYRVGAKNDPVGRSGFAHLFEHLMFKSTKHLQAEQFDRLTEDVGGYNNAFTSEDNTTFFCMIPSHHLERLIWAEAERMANLDVDEKNFKSERSVVEEEFRQTVLANPYGRLFEAIPPNGYLVHPYRRPVIGSIEDLEAASLQDVRDFHATFYRPDNAVLIVTGDFDPADLDRWVDRYFGPLTHPDKPIPRVTAKEPVRQQSSEVKITGPNVPLPAAVLIWQGPIADSADAPVLQVIQALLSEGESSRFNESLIYRQRIAQSAGFDSQLHTDAGLLTAYAIASGKRDPQSLIAPMQREIERLAKEPIPAAELAKVKNQLLTTALKERQTPVGRGQALGWAVIHHNDAGYVNTELDKLQAVTAEDVQRVLQTYIIDHPVVTLYYTQESQS